MLIRMFVWISNFLIAKYLFSSSSGAAFTLAAEYPAADFSDFFNTYFIGYTNTYIYIFAHLGLF